MQVTGMKDKVDFQYKNSFDAIRTIVKSEGLRGLYTGLSEYATLSAILLPAILPLARADVSSFDKQASTC